LRQNLRTAKLINRVSLHLCTVAELWPPAEPIFGLAFIDGKHSRGSALLDLTFAWQTVRPGGMIALHDHEPGCPGVLEAVAEFGRPVVRQVKTVAVIEVNRG
jgi:predicted O-methyltransferase YrrM